MITLKQINIIAFIVCILLYLTCYLRFAGQALLTIVQVFSAFAVTIQVFTKQNMEDIKKRIRNYWLIIILNAIVLFSFFENIMWNDFLQILFVTIIPNITAIYFIKTLTKINNIS